MINIADAPITGALSYIQVGDEETAFGTLSASTVTALGHKQEITIDPTMNTEPIYGLGNPYAANSVSGIFEGRLTLNFVMGATYFLTFVMGLCTDVSATPDTHTYTDATGYAVRSFSVENGINLDTDSLFKYLGCVVDTCEITGRVGGTIDVTMNVMYANETKATSGLDATPGVDSELPFVFSQASVQLPSGTTLARVQSFTFRIVKNAELIPGLGSRIASNAVWKESLFEFEMELSYENAAMIEDMYGQATGPLTTTNPAGEATMVFTITNSGAAAAERSLTFTMGKTFITGHTLPQRVGEHMVQSVRGYSITETSIVGVDETPSSPWGV